MSAKKTIFNIFKNSKILSIFLKSFVVLIPSKGRFKRFNNAALIITDLVEQKKIVNSNPLSVKLAPHSTCNYKCLFCEIHKDDIMFPNRVTNSLTLGDYKQIEGIFSSAWRLDFYGGSAEPLLGKGFKDLVLYLKKKYGTQLFVNTNASALTKSMSDTMIETGFDEILVSYHAGETDNYVKLMTGKIETVDKNLSYLNAQKNRLNKRKPVVNFNYALQKANAQDSFTIAQKAKKFGVNKIFVNRYHSGINKLQDLDISYDYDIESGNKKLIEIYREARAIDIQLEPKEPRFWKKGKESSRGEIRWDEDNWNRCFECLAPWLRLSMNPSLDYQDSFLVGPCNRIELFRLNYKEANLKTDQQFKQLWNHPVLQYLRRTVNSKDEINPICKYCKNFERERVRNIDHALYAEVRDKAVIEFFLVARKTNNWNEVKGIEVLSENPCADYKFVEQMALSP